MDCSLAGSSAHGIFQPRILELVLPFPSPGDLSNSGIEPRSPALQTNSLLSEPLGKPQSTGVILLNLSLYFSLEMSLLYPMSLNFILLLHDWISQMAWATFQLQLKFQSASRFQKTWAPGSALAAWTTFWNQHTQRGWELPVSALPLQSGISCYCMAFIDTQVQFSSIAQSYLTLCYPMDCSTQGFPVLDQLPKPAQIHVHQVSDAIQPSHPVTPFSSCLQSCPASGSFPMSQFFTSGGQSIGTSASTSVLPMNLQDQLLLWLSGLISCSPFSTVFFTTVQKHYLFGAQLSLWSNSHIHTWLLEKPQLWLDGPLLAK